MTESIHVTVSCDRCQEEVEGMRFDNATAGFYEVGPGKSWAQFAREGEDVVCDTCMQADPVYQAVYGPNGGGAPLPPDAQE